jgi:hypothetical protein
MSVGIEGLSILRRIASMTYIGFEKKQKCFGFFVAEIAFCDLSLL